MSFGAHVAAALHGAFNFSESSGARAEGKSRHHHHQQQQQQQTRKSSPVARMMSMSGPRSLVKQNFHKDCEDAINKQINMELYASYSYQAMAYHFQRCDVALPGMHKYFKKCSDEETEHARKLMEYMNSRGGHIVLMDISAPEQQEWPHAHEAMEHALDLERRVNDALLNLHSIASGHMDVNLCDFLETHYLQEQVDAIKEIADHVTNMKRVGEGLGVYMFDRELDKQES